MISNKLIKLNLNRIKYFCNAISSNRNISTSYLMYNNEKNENFLGLDGTSPCSTKSIVGPEPIYQKLNSDTYQLFKYNKRLELNYGGILPQIQLAYETWGKLNEARDNAILIFTGLSANSHAKSSQTNPNAGWWEDFIGPGLAIDTDKFFVICVNHLGSCFGSTGPSSINPLSKKQYATTFPIFNVKDMVDVQFKLLDHLKIDKLNACIGSSLGGMCSITAAVHYSQRVLKLVAISTCAKAEPSSIAYRYLQRKAIMLDPNWNNGFFYDGNYPKNGIRLAREIATTTYRSGPEWNIRFARNKLNQDKPIDLCPTFEIENYLNYQGEMFSLKYDPNSLLYLSKAMDLFDISEGFKSDQEALSKINCPVMIMGCQTDILFPVKQQRDLARWLKEAGNKSVTYFEMDSIYGHDTFLLNLNDVGTAMKGFLETSLKKTGDLSKSSK